MLIRALCDYYDILAKAGSVLPSGYSPVKVHYLISLTEAGLIDEIIPYQDQEEIKMAKGKIKKVWMPKNVVLPQRTEKPGIEANSLRRIGQGKQGNLMKHLPRQTLHSLRG